MKFIQRNRESMSCIFNLVLLCSYTTLSYNDSWVTKFQVSSLKKYQSYECGP